MVGRGQLDRGGFGTRNGFLARDALRFHSRQRAFYFDEVAGYFDAAVKITGRYNSLYDQAGLMIRSDDRNWIKCGIEFVDGVQQASAVATRGFSDWSVVPLNENPRSIWLRVERRKECVQISYSLDDEKYSMLRMCYFPPEAIVAVGPMCASPEGEGFPVTFEQWSLSPA